MPVNYTRFRTEWAGLSHAYARAWGRQSVIPMRILGNTVQGKAYSGNLSYDASLSSQLISISFDLRKAETKLPLAMNALAQLLARVDQRYSQQMSSGPRDPRQQQPNLAWKIPVRRISGAYFQGWFVRRVAPGVWVVYNPTREAYYIEYGIHTSGRRVRRPVRKLALIKTLRYADKHKVGGYVWEGIFGHMRQTGASGRGRLSSQFQPQSPSVMGML